ncbi:MAG: orotidine-5'-phosphate decarboxylase [Planctomycetota bacterium]
MLTHFADRLIAAVKQKQTPLIVGIDPRVSQLPSPLAANQADSPTAIANKVASYCIELIDVVADLVPAVKPQSAFFELLGPHGMVALAAVIDHAKAKGLLVIMDAKRGDIGSTANAYAHAFLGNTSQSSWACDCLTVNPFLGADTLTPFVDVAHQTGSGLFVLTKTSNPESNWLQTTKNEQSVPVYRMIADHLQSLSAAHAGDSGYGNIGAVIGATYPDQLAELRSAMPNTLFLIPGFGAQGGSANDVAPGLDDDGLGGLINSSRGIIFAYEKSEYAHLPWTDAVRQATLNARDRIAEGTSAGKLRG